MDESIEFGFVGVVAVAPGRGAVVSPAQQMVAGFEFGRFYTCFRGPVEPSVLESGFVGELPAGEGQEAAGRDRGRRAFEGAAAGVEAGEVVEDAEEDDEVAGRFVQRALLDVVDLEADVVEACGGGAGVSDQLGAEIDAERR